MHDGQAAIRRELAQTFARTHDRPPEGTTVSHTGIAAKREKSAELQTDVEAFLAAGNSVEVIPTGVGVFDAQAYIKRPRSHKQGRTKSRKGARK